MFDTPIDYVKAGKLTTTLVAACLDPTGIVIIGAGADAVLEAHAKFANQHSDLAKIATASQKRLQKSLKSPRFKDTDGLHTLLWKQLDHCAGQIADPDNPIPNADEIYTRMRTRLQSFENRTVQSMDAFADWILPELHILCDDPDLLRILGPSIERHKEKQRKQQAEDIKSIKTMMENPESQSNETLTDLATRFGLKDAANYNRGFLLTHLHKTAEDFQRIASELAKFEAKNDHISQLHAQALKALENFDRLTAKSLLAEAKKQNNLENLRPALETNADLSKTEAEIALLDGDAETAYHILSATADSFAAIDPRKPIDQRVKYAELLYLHGRRYGGDGLRYSIRMKRDVLSANLEKTNPALYGDIQHKLGSALASLGVQIGGPEGENFIREAISAYRTALQYRPRSFYPQAWGDTQNALGTVYCDLGYRVTIEETKKLFGQALECYNRAFQVRTKERFPEDWATTQSNLGNLLRHVGSLCPGSAGAKLFKDAETAFLSSLEVRTRKKAPEKWARTTENLAIVYFARALHESCLDPKTSLREALTKIDDCLSFFDRVNWPYNHTKATELRSQIQTALAS